MKPVDTLLAVLTIAAAGVGVASAGFTTSTRTSAVSLPLLSHPPSASTLNPHTVKVPDLAPRNSDAATLLNARQDRQTVHETITRTVRGGGSRTSTRATQSTSRISNDDDDEDDNNNDDKPSTTRLENPSTTDKSDSSSSPTSSETATELSSSPSQSPEHQQSTQPKGGLSAGAAAGIAAGAVALLAIIAAVAFLLWRRRQGGIRGAVVTADYPQGMARDGGATSGGEELPKLSSSASPSMERSMEMGMGVASPGMVGAEMGKDDPFYPGMEDVDLEGGNNSGGRGVVSTAFMIPPAGTGPGDPGYDQYYQQQQQQQQRRRQTQWATAGDPRPVSAFTAYPSPGLPVLPVSPLTPYFPDESQRQVSSYYGPVPNSMPGRESTGGAEMGSSPGMPNYLIPGGNKSRAMSFSSVSRVGGGAHVAELIGSPPPAIPSVYVVVEGQSPTRRSHTAELPG